MNNIKPFPLIRIRDFTYNESNWTVRGTTITHKTGYTFAVPAPNDYESKCEWMIQLSLKSWCTKEDLYDIRKILSKVKEGYTI
jgi:hypothetical protein